MPCAVPRCQKTNPISQRRRRRSLQRQFSHRPPLRAKADAGLLLSREVRLVLRRVVSTVRSLGACAGACGIISILSYHPSSALGNERRKSTHQRHGSRSRRCRRTASCSQSRPGHSCTDRRGGSDTSSGRPRRSSRCWPFRSCSAERIACRRSRLLAGLGQEKRETS